MIKMVKRWQKKGKMVNKQRNVIALAYLGESILTSGHTVIIHEFGGLMHLCVLALMCTSTNTAIIALKYPLRQFIRYIYSQAEKDMELDHKDHPLTLQNWKLQEATYLSDRVCS